MNTLILKVLILGGTTYLGPHLVHELQKKGHDITLFNRGTQKAIVKTIIGDREGNLDGLKNHRWDAIIDTSGHLPRLVDASSEILSTAANRYTFISTIGVYKDFLSLNIDENYPLATLDDETCEEINDKTYGALKALCEKSIERSFPNRALIIRPGLIVGPRDPTNRFAYWPLRILEGGEILAPGSPRQSVQFIDVRDLAKWIVSMVEQQQTGVYNTTGIALSFEELLNRCAKTLNQNSSFTWVDEDFLIRHQVQDWTELPLWLSHQRHMPGFLNVNGEKAMQTGLTCRPLSETLSAIIDWEKNRKVSIGLDRQKEQHLLKQWKEKTLNLQ